MGKVLSQVLSSHYFSNVVVLLLVGGGVLVALWVRKNRLWREALRELWRRRPFALVVFGLYTAIALTDSVAWIGGGASGSDVVAASQPRSVVDRVFADKSEKSYSQPFADKEFYGGAALRHPSSHVLGTDLIGRDVLYVMLKGCRVALLIGGLTSLIAIPLALFFGVGAGYFGKWIDDIVFFVMSTLASIPGILFLVALIMALGRSTTSVCIALGVTSWVGFCRLSRGETMKLRELDYVQAARALGVSDTRIVLRHILPNLMHLVVITFVLMFSGLVLSEAVLAWLGIGADGSWGQMIAQAKNELSRDPIVWWNLLAAAVAQFALILALNFIGDAVRDILDPRTLRENA